MDAALQDFEQSVSLNPKFAITQVQKKFTGMVSLETVLKLTYKFLKLLTIKPI